MMQRSWLIGGAMLVAGFVSSESLRGQEGPFVFRDAGAETGLLPDGAGIQGHAAAWGDVDGDGWIDLYIGAFHTEGSKPNQFFRNEQGTFQLDGQQALRISSRPTGAIFVDLDNDGDLDLYVASMPKVKPSKLAKKTGHALRGCSLFRNDGGKFTDISQGNGACPDAFGGRSATVLDYDGDGLLDLLVGEDPIPGYNGSQTHSSRLFRNLGELQFEDVTQEVGIPAGIPALGVAAGDVNNDGWPDLFLACAEPGNRLFLNNGAGKFREAPGSRELFAWEHAGGDNMICGVCFGDVNNDGLLDMVLGQHFDHPWRDPVANRLYLNRGIENGAPRFEDVTEQAGLVPLPMKAPHVEIQDFDNDGRPDIYTSLVKLVGKQRHPVIFRNLGTQGGTPHFRADALAVNDFPTAADRATQGSGALFDKMIVEKKIIYTAPGPSGDYNNDGRLDLFLANWWIESPSLLLRNETPGGHWLQVQVRGGPGVNRMGVGSRVNLYEAGKAGEADALLGCREIATGYGYASGQPAIAHFGLGKTTRCDVEVIFPHDKGRLVQSNVEADRRVSVGP